MLNWALILKPILISWNRSKKSPDRKRQLERLKFVKALSFKNSFSSIYAMRAKITRKITVSASWWNLCNIFFITLKEHKMRPEGQKKNFLETAPPLISGSGWPPPHPFPLSEGLDPGGGSGSATVTFCVRVFKPQTNDFSTKLLYNSNIYSRVSQHEPFFLSKVIWQAV